MPLRARLLTAVVILANVLGNLLLSLGMKAQPALEAASVLTFGKALLHPMVGAGVLLLVLWMACRMALLGMADLSFVLPVTSIGYVLAAVAGHLFLGEQVSGRRWLGTLLIVAGTLVVGSTEARSGHGPEERP